MANATYGPETKLEARRMFVAPQEKEFKRG